MDVLTGVLDNFNEVEQSDEIKSNQTEALVDSKKINLNEENISNLYVSFFRFKNTLKYSKVWFECVSLNNL